MVRVAPVEGVKTNVEAFASVIIAGLGVGLSTLGFYLNDVGDMG